MTSFKTGQSGKSSTKCCGRILRAIFLERQRRPRKASGSCYAKSRATLAIPPNKIAINLDNALTKHLYDRKPVEAVPLLTRLIAESYVELLGKTFDRAEYLRLTDSITLSTLGKLN